MSLNVYSSGHKLTERELIQKALKQLSNCTSLKDNSPSQTELQKSELFSITLVVIALVGYSETAGYIPWDKTDE